MDVSLDDIGHVARFAGYILVHNFSLVRNGSFTVPNVVLLRILTPLRHLAMGARAIRVLSENWLESQLVEQAVCRSPESYTGLIP